MNKDHRSRFYKRPHPDKVNSAIDYLFSVIGRDEASAVDKFKILVDEGYTEANVYLGYIYESGGANVTRNYEYAFFYFEQARKAGNIEGYLGVARCYLYGHGVPQNFEKALEIYSDLDEENDATASLMLGRMYHQGMGVPTNLIRAKEYYKKAFLRGNIRGLGCLGVVESQLGYPIKGFILKIRAAVLAFPIAYKDQYDARLRAS